MSAAASVHQRQLGQALPLGMALILVGALGGVVLYNTAQSAIDKSRLVNAADAAAYSGVQWQARALNFQAYTNRAMVANQVSLAQAVTLESWTTYGRIMSENIARVLSAVPFVGAIAAGVETTMTAVDEVVSPIAGAMLSVIDGINAGIGLSQDAMFASTFAATPAVVTAVVEASDPRFTADTAYGVAGLLGNLAGWSAFTASVGNDEPDYEHMRERASMIRESQDAFTRNRDWEFFGDYLYIAPGVKIEIVKEGRTELIEREGDDGLEWEWKAKDTQSFHTRINLLFKKKHIEVPIGYGGAFANDASEQDRTIQEGACTGYASWSGGCVRMLDENEEAESLVDANRPSLSGSDSLIDMSGYHGLRSFRRLSDDSRERPMPTLRLRVEAAMPLADMASAASMTQGDPFQAPLVARGDLSSSISIAEVYFKPPDADLWKAGDTLEFANAYSPFWSVRLAPVPAEERLAAFAMRGAGSTVPQGSAAVPAGDSALPDYDTAGGVGTLFADSAGVDLTRALGQGVGSDDMVSLAAAAAGEYGDRLASEIADEIRRELEDRLRQAVQDILAGLARDAIGSAIGQQALSTVEDVQRWADETGVLADAQQIGRTVEAARDQVRAVQEEFRRVDEILAQRFAPYFELEVADWTDRWGGQLRQLATASHRPFRLFGVPPAAAIADDSLRTLARRARLARRELLERLSLEYARLVSETTDAFEMTPRMARQLVSMLLNAYEEAQDGRIDYTLFDDVDLELPEAETDASEGDVDEP